MSSVTKWYIESKDSHTNSVIAQAMEGLHSAEKFVTLVCSDDKKRNLVESPDGYAFVARLLRSQKDLNLTFNIFRSQGNGKPTPWKFTLRKKVTLNDLKSKGTVKTGTQIASKKQPPTPKD